MGSVTWTSIPEVQSGFHCSRVPICHSLLNCEMAAFPRAIIQLPGGSWFALEQFHHGRSGCILTGTDTLNTDLTFPPAIFLPKAQSIDL